MNNKKQDISALKYTIVGLLFTTLGMFLLSSKQPIWTYLSSSILGFILTVYGLIRLVKSRKNNT